jgi:hypothetical protein
MGIAEQYVNASRNAYHSDHGAQAPQPPQTAAAALPAIRSTGCWLAVDFADRDDSKSSSEYCFRQRPRRLESGAYRAARRARRTVTRYAATAISEYLAVMWNRARFRLLCCCSILEPRQFNSGQRGDSMVTRYVGCQVMRSLASRSLELRPACWLKVH